MNSIEKNLQAALTDLQSKNQDLQLKYLEAKETISAIQSGSIDALVVNGASGAQIYTLEGADFPYRMLVETMSEGAVTLSHDLDIIYCNRRLAEMLEIPLEKIFGNPLTKYIPKEEHQILFDILTGGKNSIRAEINLRGNGGKIIPVLFSYSPFQIDKILGCLIFTDLTDIKKIQLKLKKMNENLDQLVSKRTVQLLKKNKDLNLEIKKRVKIEKNLRESEEKFMQLANAMPQLAYIARADGSVYWFNNRWFEYTGTTQEQMEGWGWQYIHDPQVLPAVMEKWKSSIETGEPFEMIYPLKNKENTYREFLARMIPFKDQEGKIIQWFGTNTDVSQIREIEKELKQSREKLTLALDNGNTGIWEWEFETNKVILDNRIEKMFAMVPDSFEGTFSDFENLINEEDLPHLRRAIKRTVEDNYPFETIFRTSYQDKDDVKYISTKGLLIKDESDHPVGITGVFFDVTGIKKDTEYLMLKLNEELLRSNKELEQFAYIASHDLQEPLRMVSSFTQLLAKKYKDHLDENAQEYIHYVIDGANRMFGLINGLLAYSRVQTRGKNFTRVNMNAVMDLVKNNLRMQIIERKAEITIGELPVIFADEAQMIQLMQNLVNNALKFSTDIPKIQVTSYNQNENAIFSIKDEGIGIDPQYFSRIFQIFQRLLPKDAYEGTGIGLSICKRIVERHEGKIWVESEPGKGSAFFFSIPNESLLKNNQER